MRWSSLVAAVAAAAASGVAASSLKSSLTPNVLPLVVRNPYLSTWLSNARAPPWESWPIFWTGQSVGAPLLPPHSTPV